MSNAKDKHSDPKSGSNDRSDDDDKVTEEFKKKKLEDLKRKAFYSVLLAFTAETVTIGNKRTHLIEKLMKELNIAQETRISFEDTIQKNLIAHQERVFSELKKVEAKPLTISVSKPPVVPTYVAATPSSKWGKVNPEALVGRRVSVRMCIEEEFEEFVIKEYDAKDEMHHLESVDPDAMEMDEVSSWIDLREVPPDDIIWRDGEAPSFETHIR